MFGGGVWQNRKNESLVVATMRTAIDQCWMESVKAETEVAITVAVTQQVRHRLKVLCYMYGYYCSCSNIRDTRQTKIHQQE